MSGEQETGSAPQSPELNIAVLGDLHGHLTLAYRLLRRWERESGKNVDVILQVGDLGAFPPPYRIDKATMRFAQKDPDELGFAQYYEGSPEADGILGSEAPDETRIGARMYFIKGNHEDFEFLHGMRSFDGGPVPVDFYGMILHAQNGTIFPVSLNGMTVRVACLGGLAFHGGPGTGNGIWYTQSEVKRLWGAGAADILLTHDVPFGAVYAEAGSRDILEYVSHVPPLFHFCGHYHEDGQQLDVPGTTRSFLLNEVGFRKPASLNAGCIGILQWRSPTDCGFELLRQPWLQDYTRQNFREL